MVETKHRTSASLTSRLLNSQLLMPRHLHSQFLKSHSIKSQILKSKFLDSKSLSLKFLNRNFLTRNFLHHILSTVAATLTRRGQGGGREVEPQPSHGDVNSAIIVDETQHVVAGVPLAVNVLTLKVWVEAVIHEELPQR